MKGFDAPFSQNLFNVSETERISEVQPDSTLHDGRREVAIPIVDLVHPISISVSRGIHSLDS